MHAYDASTCMLNMPNIVVFSLLKGLQCLCQRNVCLALTKRGTQS